MKSSSREYLRPVPSPLRRGSGAGAHTLSDRVPAVLSAEALVSIEVLSLALDHSRRFLAIHNMARLTPRRKPLVRYHFLEDGAVFENDIRVPKPKELYCLLDSNVTAGDHLN